MKLFVFKIIFFIEFLILIGVFSSLSIKVKSTSIFNGGFDSIFGFTITSKLWNSLFILSLSNSHLKLYENEINRNKKTKYIINFIK